MTSKPKVVYNPEQRYQISVREFEYQEGLVARVYQPAGTGPFPAMVDVHGGVWSLNDRTANENMHRALAGSGIVIMAVDFRQPPEYPYPAQIADVNYATRWLKSKAVEFNADPDTVGGMGGSSGGHTIILSSMRPNHPAYNTIELPNSDFDATLKYVIVGWPIVAPYERYQYAQETGNDRLVELTDAYFSSVDAMNEGSPYQILKRGEPAVLPPLLIAQGTADTNLPVPVTEQFARDYRGAGGYVELELFEDMPHNFANVLGAESDRAVDLMRKFVARCLS